MTQYKIRVLYPKSEKDMKYLRKQIVKAHIEAVGNCINKLSCPTEQKMILIDHIINECEAS